MFVSLIKRKHYRENNFFETKSYYVSQAGLTLMILLLSEGVTSMHHHTQLRDNLSPLGS
jgi:hypothetical protein